MLKSKSFLKKTRRGGVVTVNREHYLRDDIDSGLTDGSKLDTSMSIAVPDTNILLHQIDLLEHKDVTNVVLLSTVLEEVKHRSR